MIVDALTGWLGLVAVLLAAGCALAADQVRQGVGPDGQQVPSHLRWTRSLTVLAVVFAVLGAGAVLLRFIPS